MHRFYILIVLLVFTFFPVQVAFPAFPQHSNVHSILIAKGNKDKKAKKNDTSGWMGIVALASGILAPVALYFSFFEFYVVFAILAIMYGIKGKHLPHHNREMALAGLILGIISASILVLAAIVLIVALFILI